MPELSSEFWIATAIALVLAVVGLGVAIAMDAKKRGEFQVVCGCFLISAAIMAYGTGAWEMATEWKAKYRIPIAMGLFAILAVGVSESIRWAHLRHLEARQKSAEKPQSPAPEDELKTPVTSASSTKASTHPTEATSTSHVPYTAPRVQPQQPPPEQLAFCYVSFVGQVLNGYAPIMLVNNDTYPVDNVRLDITETYNPVKNGDTITSSVGYQKQLDVGTCRARMHEGLQERLPVQRERLEYDILIMSRYYPYREHIELHKEGAGYEGNLTVYRGGSQTPLVSRTFTLGIATLP